MGPGGGATGLGGGAACRAGGRCGCLGFWVGVGTAGGLVVRVVGGSIGGGREVLFWRVDWGTGGGWFVV